MMKVLITKKDNFSNEIEIPDNEISLIASKLTHREYRILLHTFLEKSPFYHTSRKFGCTRERVKQIFDKSIRKLNSHFPKLTIEELQFYFNKYKETLPGLKSITVFIPDEDVININFDPVDIKAEVIKKRELTHDMDSNIKEVIGSHISIKVFNLLTKNNIITLNNLYDKGENVLKISGFGRKCWNELNDALKQCNLPKLTI